MYRREAQVSKGGSLMCGCEMRLGLVQTSLKSQCVWFPELYLLYQMEHLYQSNNIRKEKKYEMMLHNNH